MSDTTELLVGDVFVPGGNPTVTYNPRTELELETRIDDYIAERRRVLSVSGPTKTGKTVLLRNTSAVADALWMSGGSIESIEDFWSDLGDKLGLFTEVSESIGIEESANRKVSGGVGFSGTTAGGERATSTGNTNTSERKQTRPMSAVVRDALASERRTLIIDDFHYIPADVQRSIVRNLKDLVFDGLGVIVAAVPHRAYDVVRVEKEMTGRFEQLDVGFWSDDELAAIADKGFAALNASVGGTITRRLVRESFSSPHLMQEFCLALSKASGLRQRAEKEVTISAPSDWSTFFALGLRRHQKRLLICSREDLGSVPIATRDNSPTEQLLTFTVQCWLRSPKPAL